MTSASPETRTRGVVKSSFDLAGGLFLLALAGLGLVGGFDLPTGTLSAIGSGMVPRVVSILVGAFGVLLVVRALLFDGDRVERWHLRGPVFILGAVLVFAMVIRGSTLTLGGVAGIPVLATVTIPPLGLIVGGPLAVIVSSLAARDTRPLEILVYSMVLTLLSSLLFKELLGLPIPFDPAGLIPDPLNTAYLGAKTAIVYVFGIVMNVLAR